MEIRYLPVDWKTYHKLAQNLAATIHAHSPKVNEIVAISRGGLTLGHLFSDLLQIPIWTIAIQSYTDIQEQGEVKIIGKLNTSIKNKHVLLVDDVSDTGKTLKRALSYLKRLRPSGITTATMFHKPQSVYKPDYFARTTSDWILFPYEPTEMITLLSDRLTKEKKSKAEIQKFLNSLGYTDDQITYVRRHFIENNHE